jgi:hypothetical protein
MSDPYQAVIDHYGALEFADLIEIGRTIGDYEIEWTGNSELEKALPEWDDPRLINFKFINRTGIIPSITADDGSFLLFSEADTYTSYTVESQRVDWQVNDAFNQAYDEILKNVIERMESHEETYDLRTKTSWDINDRMIWEELLANTVSDELNNISGLDRYRSNGIETIRSAFLNALSEDIEQGTTKYEFDCEQMSALEGSLLQRLEEHFLPIAPEESGGNLDYKSAHNYFFALGFASFNADDTRARPHAFIVSSATGNIVEATADPDYNYYSYEVSVDPNWSFERFARGEVFQSRYTDSVYGGDLDDFIRQGKEAIEVDSTFKLEL